VEIPIPDSEPVRRPKWWRQRMAVHVVSGQADVDNIIATALCTYAHDIPDPRERDGPWRPGWRPFE
jgi:hypothetical protein